jgi:hypothetical protein
VSGAFATYVAPWYLVGGADEVYAASMYVLGGLGLGLGAARSRAGWRIQMAVLLGLTALWAAALAGFLADDAVGHDCTRADPPVSRLAIRLGVPVLTVAVIGGTLLALLALQVDGC